VSFAMASVHGGGSPCGRKLQAGSAVDEDVARVAMRRRTRVKTTEHYKKRTGAEAEIVEGCYGIIVSRSMDVSGQRADVMWDNGRFFKGYCVGYRGHYDLELVDPVNAHPDDYLSDSSATTSENNSPLSSAECTPGPSGHSTPAVSPRRHAQAGVETQALQWTPSAPPSTFQWTPSAPSSTSSGSSSSPENSPSVVSGCSVSKTAISVSGEVIDANVGYLTSAPRVSTLHKHLWASEGPMFAHRSANLLSK
jgi:hypothetical protein